MDRYKYAEIFVIVLISHILISFGMFPDKGKVLSTLENLNIINNEKFLIEDDNGDVLLQIAENGSLGVGTSIDDYRVEIRSDSNEDAMRIRVNTATKMQVASNGGTTIGSSNAAPINGLFVSGKVQTGTIGTPFTSIVRLSGITDEFVNATTIPYPAGFNADNTHILAVKVFNGDENRYHACAERNFGNTAPYSVRLNSTNFHLDVNNNDFMNQPYRVVIMRIDDAD